MRADGTAVLMYHRVLPDVPVSFGGPSCYHVRGTAVTPTDLRAQLDWLATQQIPVVPLSEVVDACIRQQAPPPGVVLTFDDGYLEWVTVVVPELQSRGFAASFFISSGVHSEMTRAHPIDEYYFLLDHARVPKLHVTLTGGQRVDADLRLPADKRSLVVGALKQRLVNGSPTEQVELLAMLGAALDVTPPADLPATLYLPRTSWSQLARGGSRVEAHGHSHRRLTELDDQAIDGEVARCIATLREYVGPPRHFAYPDGAHDDRVVERAARAGVAGALTVIPGRVTAASDRLRLPRYFVRSGVQLEDLLH